MNKYHVSIMIPISTNVEANSFQEAINKAFDELAETSNYGGDGIFVTNTDTGETYEE